jgi:hypothetical protein
LTDALPGCRPTAVRHALEQLADSERPGAALKWFLISKERAMTQQAMVRGEVCFRAGDGVMMPVPPGPVEIEIADDSVTLGWTESDGSAGSTAITRDEFDRYVGEGKIKVQAAP